MKPRIYLRIASVLTFLHAVLHTIGGVFGKPTPGPASVAVAAMQANQFPVMGLMRTYFDFYRGMGLGITIVLTAESIVFWQLASLVSREGTRLRPLLFTFLVGYLAFAVNSWIYFFPPPVVVEALIALCMLMAIVSAKPVVQVGYPGPTMQHHA